MPIIFLSQWRFWPITCGAWDGRIASVMNVPDGVWFHFVLVISGPFRNDDLAFTVNGQGNVPFASQFSLLTSIPESRLTIAATQMYRIDELHFWNRRLSADEIQMLYSDSQGAGQTVEGKKAPNKTFSY